MNYTARLIDRRIGGYDAGPGGAAGGDSPPPAGAAKPGQGENGAVPGAAGPKAGQPESVPADGAVWPAPLKGPGPSKKGRATFTKRHAPFFAPENVLE